MSLTQGDYEAAAGALQCDVAAVKAVAEVESAGAGFNSDGTVKILFEAHIFDRETHGAFRAQRPDLSSKAWNKSLYAKSEVGEHKRLADALTLNRAAALRSTSWGRFQIMGFNHKAAGYETVDAFVEDMKLSEAKHLFAFIQFLKTNKLDKPLREHDWPTFAKGYNGPKYGLNRYDVKLGQAWRKFSVGAVIS